MVSYRGLVVGNAYLESHGQSSLEKHSWSRPVSWISSDRLQMVNVHNIIIDFSVRIYFVKTQTRYLLFVSKRNGERGVYPRSDLMPCLCRPSWWIAKKGSQKTSIVGTYHDKDCLYKWLLSACLQASALKASLEFLHWWILRSLSRTLNLLELMWSNCQTTAQFCKQQHHCFLFNVRKLPWSLLWPSCLLFPLELRQWYLSKFHDKVYLLVASVQALAICSARNSSKILYWSICQ